MISLHTSPLAVPGVGDAGGLNVYVSEVARRLGERGLHVDVFTRDDGSAPDRVVEVSDNLRVLHVPAGPRAPVAKEQLPDLVPEFADQLETVAGGYDLVHSHYWLSGMAGLALRRSHGLPLVHTMHTMAHVKNGSRPAAGPREPDLRALGESQIVSGAETLTANTTDEASDLVRAYGARPSQVVVVPPGVDLHTFHPVRPAAVPRAARGRPRVAGGALRRSHPAAQGARRAHPRRGPARRARAAPPRAPAPHRHRQRQRARRGLVAHAGTPGRGARRRRRGRVPTARGALGAVPLLLRVRRGRRAFVQRVLRPGRAGGPGVRATGGRDRRGRPAARGP